MNKQKKSLSQFTLAIKRLGRNRITMLCTTILVLLYIAAIFADFLSPYSYDNEDRNYSYCPPMSIRFIGHGRIARPYIQNLYLTFDNNHKRIYKVDERHKYPLQFFYSR